MYEPSEKPVSFFERFKFIYTLLPFFLLKQDRYKEARAAPAKRTKAEVEKDASKARETHRQGHGARGKRARKVARPIDDDDSEAPKRVRWWI